MKRGLARRTLVHAGWAAPAAWLLGGCAGKASSATARWATGGTARIGAAVRASTPFAQDAANVCQLACEATIGPCHTLSPERSDVSEGWDGLPLHMQLRIVDARCAPVAGAIVEIWHTNHTGGYSGRIARMCNNAEADLARQFFRGWQRSDAQGIVRFDSCYPGWYGGRANHVHVRVSKGGYDARDEAPAWLTTQLLFSDALNREVFANEPLYRRRGQPDTLLADDGVVGQESDKTPYLFDVQQVDGVMLASRTLAIRSRLDEAICTARGMPPPQGPGGPGHPPGPGGPPPR
ncbi:MAG: intradiol ring-cleavage dioxygenase [Pseudorhodoferax sp.]